MATLSLFVYFVAAGLVGAGVYELVLWRKRKKYQHVLSLYESGGLDEIPPKYQKEPKRIEGFLYFIVVIGIGWIVGMIAFGILFGLLLGACFLGMQGFM